MKICKFFFFFFFSLLFFNSVLSLGVSPGRIEINFEPNLKTSFDMTVVNTPPKDRDVEIYTNLYRIGESMREEYRDVIDLEKSRFSFSKDESGKSFKVNLNFPEGFSEGGTHILGVGARPYSDTDSEGVSVLAGNEIAIFVTVPDEYVDEKYKVIKDVKIIGINAESVKSGEVSDIEIKIKSESDVDLNDVYAVVKVFNKGDEVRSLETNKVSIGPNEERILVTEFNTGRLAGNLVLNVEVFYGIDSTKGNGILNIIGADSGGMTIEKKKFSINWWWIIIGIVIFLLLLIIILMFILFMAGRKKKKK